MKKLLKFVLLFLILSLVCVAGIAAYTYFTMPDVEQYLTVNPRVTKMMEFNHDETEGKLTFVPLDNISKNLIKAVVLSEDPAFFHHKGTDWAEMRLALKQDWEKKEFHRGASTITMQLARNLYLSPRKNPLRKIQEIIIAAQMEKKLSKRRILELYLNTAEWGPHVYGAEEGAKYNFGASCSRLSAKQACEMASILPSPKKWRINDPQDWVQKKMDRLRERFDSSKMKIPDFAHGQDEVDEDEQPVTETGDNPQTKPDALPDTTAKTAQPAETTSTEAQ